MRWSATDPWILKKSEWIPEVLKIFSGGKKKAKSQTAGAPGELSVGGGLLPASAEVSEPSILRKQISRALEKNPEQVKQLFSSWMEQRA